MSPSPRGRAHATPTRRRITSRTRPSSVTLDHLGDFTIDDDAMIGDEDADSVIATLSTALRTLAWLRSEGCSTEVLEFVEGSGYLAYRTRCSVRQLVTILASQWDESSLGEAVGLALCAAAAQSGPYAIESEWRGQGCLLVEEWRAEQTRSRRRRPAARRAGSSSRRSR